MPRRPTKAVAAVRLDGSATTLDTAGVEGEDGTRKRRARDGVSGEAAQPGLLAVDGDVQYGVALRDHIVDPLGEVTGRISYNVPCAAVVEGNNAISSVLLDESFTTSTAPYTGQCAEETHNIVRRLGPKVGKGSVAGRDRTGKSMGVVMAAHKWGLREEKESGRANQRHSGVAADSRGCRGKTVQEKEPKGTQEGGHGNPPVRQSPRQGSQ